MLKIFINKGYILNISQKFSFDTKANLRLNIHLIFFAKRQNCVSILYLPKT